MKKILTVLVMTVAMALAAVQTVHAADATQVVPEGFSGLEDRLRYAWAYNYETFTATQVAGQTFSLLAPQARTGDSMVEYVPGISYLTALSPVAAQDIALGKRVAGVSGMDILLKDDQKFTYGFYENGITVEKAMPGKSAGKPVACKVDGVAYQTLLKALNKAAKDSAAYPLWLANMRESVASGVDLDIAGNKLNLSSYKEDFPRLFDALRWFSVKAEPPTVIRAAHPPKSGNLVSVIFRKGAVITLEVTDSKLTIYASNMAYALQYQHRGRAPLSELELLAKGGRVPPMTAKPVIYLYPQKPTDVSVTLGFQGRLDHTDPVYHGGWQVTAYPDGRLINRQDGKQYPYLYWDGNADVDWDLSRGFVIADYQTETFLRMRLTGMGLTKQETQDFIDYWLPKLQQSPYNLITFQTAQYEQLAPLTITPSPDSIIRVHMVYEPLQAPFFLPTQTLPKYERKGFIAVEWGGTCVK